MESVLLRQEDASHVVTEKCSSLHLVGDGRPHCRICLLQVDTHRIMSVIRKVAGGALEILSFESCAVGESGESNKSDCPPLIKSCIFPCWEVPPLPVKPSFHF